MPCVGRRHGQQLPPAGFRRGNQEIYWWKRGRCRCGYNCWRLCCKELQGCRTERPYCPDRCPEWSSQGAEPDGDADQAPYAYGFYITVSQRCGESTDCAGTGTASLAPVARGKIQAPDIQGIQARRSSTCPCTD